MYIRLRLDGNIMILLLSLFYSRKRTMKKIIVILKENEIYHCLVKYYVV